MTSSRDVMTLSNGLEVWAHEAGVSIMGDKWSCEIPAADRAKVAARLLGLPDVGFSLDDCDGVVNTMLCHQRDEATKRAEDAEAKRDRDLKEIDRLAAELDTAKRELSSARGAAEGFAGQIDALRAENAALTGRVTALEAALRAIDAHYGPAADCAKWARAALKPVTP